MGGPATVDLRSEELWQDPHPVWRAARARHRFAVSTSGETILLRAADLDIVGSHRAFAPVGLDALRRLGIEDGPFFDWRRLTLAVVDGEQHRRLRSVVARSFTPRRVDALREGVRSHAEALLDAVDGRGRFDVVRDFAGPLPLWVICASSACPPRSTPRSPCSWWAPRRASPTR